MDASFAAAAAGLLSSPLWSDASSEDVWDDASSLSGD
jgi:hypothetical protein